ncbi:uncharacterized protein [Branchiostoma lanceolatum]|uniref:uncharacterized protein n=1 Tax=Branchiostoma lanceolatum TaxID=7740 RepID=UPI003453A8A8
MGKTRAEIQKAYRERKKAKDGAAYRKKEVDRVMKYYTPAVLASKEDLEKRRAKGREKMRRQKAKRERLPKLKIKMDFAQKKSGPSSKIKQMQYKLDKTLKAKRKLEKRLERLKMKEMKVPTRLTPRSKTDAEIRQAGLTPRRVPSSLRKKILFSNVFTSGLRERYEKKKTEGKRVIRRMVAGKVMKKYRLMNTLSNELGFARNARNTKHRKTRRSLARARLRRQVQEFLERDDNSRMMPGKNDCKKVGKEKLQVRILSNYLSTLRDKFEAETGIKISLSHFAKMRPQNMKLACFLSRNTCLCTRHQNFALKLKTLKQHNCVKTTNPDNFLQAFPDADKVESLLSNLPPDGNIKYDEWKRVEVDGKKKMKIVTSEVETTAFCAKFKEEVPHFRQHVARANEQYSQLKTLKENLDQNHIVIQMDFAENYKVKSNDEIQSAYWNCDMVTLHPTIIYYKSENGELQHESICVVSDELGHNAATVFAILKRVVPEVKQKHPAISYIHYWTDSPSSQYRNKTMFSILSDHESLFGVPACWNYFEAGHGKGPCDGVGGTAKRMADQAVNHQETTIQDAHDFYKWASQQEKSVIKYMFVHKAECQESQAYLAEKYGQVKAIPGTMSFHAVVGRLGEIESRSTTCYCERCFDTNGFRTSTTCKWEKHKISTNTGPTAAEASATIRIDDYVAAVYDSNWYVGVVEDEDDGEYCVRFMQQAGQKFKWPRRKDDLWIKPADVLCVVEKPQATGKSQRMFTFSEATLTHIEECYASKVSQK